MSKSRKKSYDYEDDEYRTSKKQKKRDIDRRKKKRMVNDFKSKNIDNYIDYDDFYEDH